MILRFVFILIFFCISLLFFVFIFALHFFFRLMIKMLHWLSDWSILYVGARYYVCVSVCLCLSLRVWLFADCGKDIECYIFCVCLKESQYYSWGLNLNCRQKLVYVCPNHERSIRRSTFTQKTNNDKSIDWLAIANSSS